MWSDGDDDDDVDDAFSNPASVSGSGRKLSCASFLPPPSPHPYMGERRVGENDEGGPTNKAAHVWPEEALSHVLCVSARPDAEGGGGGSSRKLGTYLLLRSLP